MNSFDIFNKFKINIEKKKLDNITFSIVEEGDYYSKVSVSIKDALQTYPTYIIFDFMRDTINYVGYVNIDTEENWKKMFYIADFYPVFKRSKDIVIDNFKVENTICDRSTFYKVDTLYSLIFS